MSKPLVVHSLAYPKTCFLCDGLLSKVQHVFYLQYDGSYHGLCWPKCDQEYALAMAVKLHVRGGIKR